MPPSTMRTTSLELKSRKAAKGSRVWRGLYPRKTWSLPNNRGRTLSRRGLISLPSLAPLWLSQPLRLSKHPPLPLTPPPFNLSTIGYAAIIRHRNTAQRSYLYNSSKDRKPYVGVDCTVVFPAKGDDHKWAE